jgi:NDP-sugar pyrophosphorylase family protein
MFHSPEDPLLDTGGGIKQAQPLLEGETFIVLNCDTIIDLSLGAVIDFHRHHRATATMVLRPDPDAARYGIIETDQHHRIRRFLGAPAKVPGPLRPWMFTGLHVMEARVFSFMPASRPFSITRETYPQLLLASEPLFGFVHSGPWMVVDSAEGVARAEKKIRNKEVQLSYLSPARNGA